MNTFIYDLEIGDRDIAVSSERVLRLRSHGFLRSVLRLICVTRVDKFRDDLQTTDSFCLFSNSIAVGSCDGTAKDVEPVEREGTLHVKFTVLDGKVRSRKNLICHRSVTSIAHILILGYI